eukprot:2259286-Amphidinium_carterae.1
MSIFEEHCFYVLKCGRQDFQGLFGQHLLSLFHGSQLMRLDTSQNPTLSEDWPQTFQNGGLRNANPIAYNRLCQFLGLFGVFGSRELSCVKLARQD